MNWKMPLPRMRRRREVNKAAKNNADTIWGMKLKEKIIRVLRKSLQKRGSLFKWTKLANEFHEGSLVLAKPVVPVNEIAMQEREQKYHGLRVREVHDHTAEVLLFRGEVLRFR